MIEWGVVDYDVVFGDVFGFQVGFEDFVGGVWVDVVGVGEYEVFNVQVVEQVVYCWDCLLVGCGVGVEDVFGGFFVFVLYWVEQQVVEFFYYWQYGFMGY